MAQAPSQGNEGQVSQTTIVWENINITQIDKSKYLEQQARYKRSESVKVSKNNHSAKSSVVESKVNYEYMQQEDVAKLVGGSAVTGAVAFYAIDLAIEQTFMATIGAELAYAAGIGASGGIVGVGVASVGALGVAGWTYFKNQKEKEKYQSKKEFNRKVGVFNSKLQEFVKIGKELKKCKEALKTQERELLKKFDTILSFERNDPLNKSILLIGPTGFGKSTVANRLMGSTEDVFTLSELDSKEILYKVAEMGKKASETDRLKKVTKKVIMTSCNKETTIFNLSVIDTAGAFDSKNRGIHQTNEMLEFYRSFGGVNMFCIVVRFDSKIDSNYIQLLNIYEKFWGESFWKHCCLIISYCDKDSKINKKIMESKLQGVKDEISNQLYKISNGKWKNIKMFEFGDENFEESLQNMFKLLNLENGGFEDKYVCDKIKSPIDNAWIDVQRKFKIYKSKGTEIQRLKNELDKIKRDFDQ